MKLEATNKHLSPEHYIFDDVIGADELLWIYHELLSTSSWTLTRSSTGSKPSALPFISKLPGLNIEPRGDVHVHFLSGYFKGVIFKIETFRQEKSYDLQFFRQIFSGFTLAQSPASPGLNFMWTSNEENVWTVLGFLNPVWNARDGGEFFLGDYKVEYKAGRFVVFPCNILHDGGYVKNEKLSYWRVAVNIILDNEEPAAGYKSFV